MDKARNIIIENIIIDFKLFKKNIDIQNKVAIIILSDGILPCKVFQFNDNLKFPDGHVYSWTR